jgi:hypothetical protein
MLFGYKSGETTIGGKAPDGYGIRVVTLYSSDDSRCMESDWNTGGRKSGITHEATTVRVVNGKYNATFYRHLKKNFCDWDIIYTDIELISPRVKEYDRFEIKKPIYTVTIIPANQYQQKKAVAIKGNTLEESFLCVLEDRFKTKKQKITQRSMTCVNKDKEYGNDIKIDKPFKELNQLKVNFNLKDTIFCFVGRRECPTYTKMVHAEDLGKTLKIEAGILKPKAPKKYKYTINKQEARSLMNSLDLDSAEYDMDRAEQIVKHNGSLLTGKGYRMLQSVLAWDFSYGNFDFDALKMLTRYGYDITKYKREYVTSPKAMKILEKLDIEESYFCTGYDYAPLPKEVQKILNDNNITLDNFYIQKKREESLLPDIASRYKEKSPEVISWLIEHGYRADGEDLGYALYNTLRNSKLKKPTEIIDKYLALGADLKSKRLQFALMTTMRERFDDIATLKRLIKAGVDINARRVEYGSTVLFSLNYKLGDKYSRLCAYDTYKGIIQKYIELGADINAETYDGKSLLESVEMECDKQALKELGAKE